VSQLLSEESGYTVDAKCNFSVHAVADKAYLILIRVFSDEQWARDQVLHSIDSSAGYTHPKHSPYARVAPG